MKKTLLFSFLVLSSLLAVAQPKKGFEIKVKIKGYSSPMLYIGNYYGDKEYIKDSARVNSKGWFVFKSETEPLPCGIYEVINAERNTRLFEIMVNSQEQFFSVETDSAEVTSKMKITGSAENEKFYEYLKFIDNKGQLRYDLQMAMERVKGNPDSTKIYSEAIKGIDSEVAAFRQSFMEKNPTTLTARIFKSMMEPDIPEAPLNADGTRDSLFPYIYYKTHFWDNVDFTEDCLVRTPVFFKRLERWMKQMTLQIPDSINASADIIVAKARPHREMYRFVVWWITNHYESSKLMCISESVPVHMFKNYYTFKDAYWMDSASLIRVHERVKVLEHLLCDKITPNLIMRDTAMKAQNLHKVKAKYTVLLFWDPDCSHCKKDVPQIHSMYERLKKHGVEVYAVGVEQEYDKWKQFIIDHKLSWINVIDVYNETNFRYIYDINSTPVIYLLDENKKIIAKQMGASQLEDILEREVGLKDKNAPFPEIQKQDPSH